jgi:hypothetical protein
MRARAINEKAKYAVKFPEKSLFSTLSPCKVDQRKVALEKYIQQLISTPLDRISDICEFLSTDVVQTEQNDLVRLLGEIDRLSPYCLTYNFQIAGIQGGIFDQAWQKFRRLDKPVLRDGPDGGPYPQIL